MDEFRPNLSDHQEFQEELVNKPELLYDLNSSEEKAGDITDVSTGILKAKVLQKIVDKSLTNEDLFTPKFEVNTHLGKLSNTEETEEWQSIQEYANLLDTYNSMSDQEGNLISRSKTLGLRLDFGNKIAELNSRRNKIHQSLISQAAY